MTKTYRDEIDALNDLRHALKAKEVPTHLAASGAGWVLYAGHENRHAVSYQDQTFNVHEGPAFATAADCADALEDFEADHDFGEPRFEVKLSLNVGELFLLEDALTERAEHIELDAANHARRADEAAARGLPAEGLRADSEEMLRRAAQVRAAIAALRAAKRA